MKKAAIFFLVLAIISTVVFGAWAAVRIVKVVQLDLGCVQYLKRAADASTVETAKEELAKAISYAEENNLTDGVVSIFLRQPGNDVGYWYNNMVEAYNELDNLPEDASSLEKTNVLMKLRETLTDEGETGVIVTIPCGISIYPNNVAYFWWGLLSFLLAIVFYILWFVFKYCIY